MSKPILIVSVLFAASLASALAGYAYYHSYSAVLSDLSRNVTIYDFLAKVRRLEFNVSSPNDGNFTVELVNDPATGRATLTYSLSNGTLLLRYEFAYTRGAITSARLYNATANTTTVVPVNEMERILRSPFTLVTSQGQAGAVTVTGIKPSPGLAPLTLPYEAARNLNIDWRRARSPLAFVRVGFTTYNISGAEYKGVAALIEPRTPLPTSPWTQLTSISMIIVRVDGIPVVAEAGVVAGTDSLTIKLVAVETTG